MRWFVVMAMGAAWALAGCSTTREITITSKPADALIGIDGTDRGLGPVTEKFSFRSDEVHHVTARRLGYNDEDIPLSSQYDKPDLLIEMHPRTKRFSVHVAPVAGNISIDGKPEGESPVEDVALALPFTVDEKNQPITHTIQASRPGYQPVEQVVRWGDANTQVTLSMDLMRKDLLIRTNPPGASVMIGEKPMGKSPIEARNFAFPPDPATGQIAPQTVVVSKAGYDPVQTKIDWDNGRRDYEVTLAPRAKSIHVSTDPRGAEVLIDGKPLERDSSGTSVARLSFPPVDDRGTLRTYNAVVSKKTSETEWAPEELTIGWDDGKSEYSATLSEVKTRPVELLRPKAVRGDDGWRLTPEVVHTLGMKDVGEPGAAMPPTRITELPVGTAIDSVVSSPDGQFLAFSVLSGTNKDNFHAQIEIVKADGSAGTNLFGDGRSLDLTPSFTADGGQIVFASNRGGRHVSIWEMATNGEGGITQLTSGDSTDLYPTVDSDPKPRLYYQSLVDTRPDPRLYMTQLGTTLRTDLTQAGGQQPRVSPKADAVVFAAPNAKTGKREIFKISDRGGAPVNLTNTPDSDCFDPVWSKDGDRIAFVSDRGVDSDNHNNFDIWILDLRHPDKPVRLTTNGSWDDCPAWDPGGKAIYFRSNRGGSWQIWRIGVK